MNDKAVSTYLEIIKQIQNNSVAPQWNSLLITFIKECVSYSDEIETGNWLTRARHHREKVQEPYVWGDIGFNHNTSENNNLKQRFGNMLYLTNDFSSKTAFEEIKLQEAEQATLGHFYICDDLNLLSVEQIAARVDYNMNFSGLDSQTAACVFLMIIQNWIRNPAVDVSESEVYQVTNYIADLVRNNTDYDGIYYQSVYSKNYCNVALFNENKLRWGYSELLSASLNDSKKSRVVEATYFNPDYNKFLTDTAEYTNCKHNFPNFNNESAISFDFFLNRK